MSSIVSKLINLAGNITGTLGVGNGGTGASTLTSNGVLLGNGTSAVTAVTGSSSQVLVGGSGPTFGSVPAAALPLVTQSTAGAVKNAGQLLGTNTNDTAGVGFVGETMQQTFTNQSAAASGSPLSIVSITPTAGDWDISLVATYVNSASSTPLSNVNVAITTTSNSLSTATTYGLNIVNTDSITTGAGATAIPMALPRYSVQTTGSTTYYATVQLGYSGAAAPTWRGSLTARRMR